MILEDAQELAETEIRKRLRDTGVLERDVVAHDEEAAEDDAEEFGIDYDAAEREDEELERMLDSSPVIEMLLEEVRRRRDLAPCVYPWDVGDARIERTDPAPRAGSTYEFLVWLALDGTPFRRKRRWTEAEWAFDHIVTLAGRGYLGQWSRSLPFARPKAGRQGPDVRPVSFPHAVKWLATSQLGLKPGTELARARRNDGGVDVVLWRPFRADKSGPGVVILVQCTFRRDWERKGRDIVIDTWRSWIAFRKDPITALAVPYCLADDDERRAEIEGEVWLVLDRMRICELLCEVSDDDVALLDDLELAEWLKQQVAAYDPSEAEAEEDDDAGAPDPFDDKNDAGEKAVAA